MDCKRLEQRELVALLRVQALMSLGLHSFHAVIMLSRCLFLRMKSFLKESQGMDNSMVSKGLLTFPLLHKTVQEKASNISIVIKNGPVKTP